MITRIIEGNVINIPESINELTLSQAELIKGTYTFTEFCNAFFDINLDNVSVTAIDQFTKAVADVNQMDNTVKPIHSIQIGRDIVFEKVKLSAAQYLDMLEVLKKFEGKTLEDFSLIRQIVQIAVCKEIYGKYTYSKAKEIKLDNLPYMEVYACGSFFLIKLIHSLNSLRPMSLLKRLTMSFTRTLKGLVRSLRF